MDFVYGIITTLAVIFFFVWGFFSCLGNERNIASWVVGKLIDIFK